MTAIIRLQALLPTIRRLHFASRSGSGSQCAWSGEGNGSVTVVMDADASVRFTEAGHFRLDAPAARAVPFRNVFRWTPGSEHIALSHERRGAEAAVWLFDLIEAPAHESTDLVSRDAHLCGDDRYRARLTFMDDGFDLEWTISGPKKDEYLRYRYRGNSSEAAHSN